MNIAPTEEIEKRLFLAQMPEFRSFAARAGETCCPHGNSGLCEECANPS